LLGFCLVTNLPIIGGTEQSPRITDVAGAVLGLWLLLRIYGVGVHAKPFFALLSLSFIPLLWGLNAIFDGDISTVVLGLRWVLAIPWGYALFLISRSPQQTALIWGLWWGCTANVVVLALQALGLGQPLMDIGLVVPDTFNEVYVGDQYRAPGLHGHPNASAAVVSLIVPLSLYLHFVRRARIWVVILGLGTMLAATGLTVTRSALLVGLLTAGAALIVHRNSKRSLRLALIFLYIGLPLIVWFGPPGGWERWMDPEYLQPNFGGRIDTATGALEISLEHPVGLGVEEGREELEQTTVSDTAHNAYLQTAVQHGLLFAVVLLLITLALPLRMLVLPPRALTAAKPEWMLEAMLAIQLFGLFWFEEHLNSAVFVVLMAWISASAVARASPALKAQSTKYATSVSRHSYHRAS
jgi:O-antigen ligase